MGLFDFFKRGRKDGRGVRRRGQGQRPPNQQTRQISMDPHNPPPAQPPSAPAGPGPQPTVVRRAHPGPAMAPQPVHQPAPTPADAGGKTVAIDTRRAFRGRIVGVLVGMDGEHEGQLYGLQDGQNRIGREKGCDVYLTDKTVSRPHALVIHKDGMFAIEPLNEENPTVVNDKRVDSRAPLSDGDSLKIGLTTFRFRSVA